MALSITKTDVITTWEIPLYGMKQGTVEIDRKDVSWMVNHLRRLANKIEEEQPNIHSIGIKTDNNYLTPRLFIEIL